MRNFLLNNEGKLFPNQRTFGHGWEHEQVNTGGPSTVPNDGDILGIAAKFADILLDPVEGGHLIHQTVIAT